MNMVRYIAPAILAASTLLASAPAFAGAIPDKLPSPTPASRALLGQAARGNAAFKASRGSMTHAYHTKINLAPHTYRAH
jgi:hypothetical protein